MKTKEKTINHFIKTFSGLPKSFFEKCTIFQNGQTGVMLHDEWIGWVGGNKDNRRFPINEIERKEIMNKVKSLAI